VSLTLQDLGERQQAIAYAENSLKIREAIGDLGVEKIRNRLSEWAKEKES